MSSNPSGKQLIKLLRKAGWTEGGRRTHGIFFSRRFPGEAIPRSTVVPDKSEPLADTTLGAILGVRQTGLGRSGLRDLIERFGLE